MYPTLYDLLKSTLGIEIKPFAIVNTFGLMVALSFFLAFYVMTLELKRKEKEGVLKAIKKKKKFEANLSILELAFNGLLGFLFGWKIVYMVMNFEKVRQNSQEVIASKDGNIWAGIIVGLFFMAQKYWEYLQEKKKYPVAIEKEITIHPYTHMSQITIVAFICGIVGAKFFHIFEDWSNFLMDPMGAIFSLSGLTYYGGLICGGLGVIVYANRHGIKPLHMLDVGAAAMMLTYGTGRMGCHLSGDGDWGIDNLATKPDWIPQFLWSSKYPHNVLNMGVPIDGCEGNFCNELVNPVWPTPLYEIMMCLILFVVLWNIRKRITIPGVLFGIYLIMNGTERFLIEKIRVNSIYEVAGLKFTQAEMISSFIILAGIGLIIYSKKVYRKPAEVQL